MDYTRDAVVIEGIIKSHEDKSANEQGSNSSPDFLDELSADLNSEEYSTSDLFNRSLSLLNESCNGTDIVEWPTPPSYYIVPILFSIIFIIGILGNGTLIVIFIKHKTMRNVPNMYIVNLAFGDLLVILFCVPFTSTVYTFESWPYGVVVCKFSEFIKGLSIGVSVFTLVALSADRYFAIVDPMRKLHGRRATRNTCISIAGIWVLSIGLAMPSALFSYVRVFDQDPCRTFKVCYPFPPELGSNFPQVMVMFRFLSYYAIPLGFIGTFYIIMARHLVLSTQNMPGEAQGQARQIQARKKVAKMVLSFVVIFALCFFPSHFFLLWFYFYPDAEDSFNDFWNACRIIGFCLSFFNSCINPITLYCVSGTFRKQFNEHLFCCFCDAEGRSRGGRRRNGFACGCVSLSNAGPAGTLHGANPHPFRNAYGYTQGRGLHRGSTTNSGLGTMKRKSTWDTQSTMSHQHLYNLAVNNQAQQHGTDATPTSNLTIDAQLLQPQGSPNHGGPASMTIAIPLMKISSGGNNGNGAGTTSMNSTIPLTNHPYQRDYQEYMNRINALEAGEPPDALHVSESKGIRQRASAKEDQVEHCMTHRSTIDEREITTTSFINLAPRKTTGHESNYSSKVVVSEPD